ncbi:MAG TPA: translation elongation factor Ts [Clostridiales bacterium]|nr:translation elongation factor Ts [Clostridiales bacterium]
MSFTAQDVKKLRDMTGVGMMDCKKALVETNGDIDKAVELLREKGMATAAKRAGRIASQGIVDSYIHLGGKIGVLLEVNCETDFVAKGDLFKTFVHDLTLQIAAGNPLYIAKEDVPEDVLEHEKHILRAQIKNDPKLANKPDQVIQKMIDGKMNKYYQEVCLLEQAFIKDADKKVGDLLIEAIAKTGEKISIRRFVRYEMGEGLEKKSCDLALEVEEQIAKMSK